MLPRICCCALKLATETAGITVWEHDLISGRLEDDGTSNRLFGLTRTQEFGPADPVWPGEQRRRHGPRE